MTGVLIIKFIIVMAITVRMVTVIEDFKKEGIRANRDMSCAFDLFTSSFCLTYALWITTFLV